MKILSCDVPTTFAKDCSLTTWLCLGETVFYKNSLHTHLLFISFEQYLNGQQGIHTSVPFLPSAPRNPLAPCNTKMGQPGHTK